MSARRVYIAGPMTGIPALNRPAFMQAEQQLLALGAVPANPVRNGLPDSAPWEAHMRADLAMLTLCDEILLLPGWAFSRGATLEVHIARALGMRVHRIGTLAESWAG